MQAHPIMESSRRWIPVLLMVLVAIGVQAWLLTAYAGVDLLSALVDGAVSIGLFCGLALFIMVCYRFCIIGANRNNSIRIGDTLLAGGRICLARMD